MARYSGDRGANGQNSGPTAVSADVRILVVLDITASMNEELEAVKSAVQQMVSLVSEEEDEEDGSQLSFAIVTFTEGNATGCHVSLKELASSYEACRYVNAIRLCTPPDDPSVDTEWSNGSDAEENQKAALAVTTDLDPTIPTIAFLITDAPPHLAADPHTQTYAHEMKYLTQVRGLPEDDAKDVFQTFSRTALQHFGGNLVLNCVVYSSSDAQDLYGRLSQQTGGMLMEPRTRESYILARGMTEIVRVLLQRMRHTGPRQLYRQQQQLLAGEQELQGFCLYDLSHINKLRASEQEEPGRVVAGHNPAIFAIAMDRMTAVCGSKWKRRAIGMTAATEQLRFVWHTAHYIYLASKPTPLDPDAANEHNAELAAKLQAVLQLRTTVSEQLPVEHKGHFSLSEQDIKHLAAAAAAAGADLRSGGEKSMISLETVGDALEENAQWDDWLAAVMKLLQGFPMHLHLPKDKNGEPDFMDAWSGVPELGVDRLASGDFMQLLGGRYQAKGLTDSSQYNAFLVLVEPADKLAAMVLKVASATQVLDYVTGVLMGAKGFLPNLWAGTTAACLTRMLAQQSPLTEFQWGQLQQIVHTLRTRHRNAAWAVSQEMQQGRANPADAISKLLLGALRISGDALSAAAGTAASGSGATAVAAEDAAHVAGGSVSDAGAAQMQALGLVLQEWLASMVQSHYGKSTPKSDAEYLKSVLQYVPPDVLLANLPTATGKRGGDAFDPLQQMHPLEHSSLKPEQVQPDWLDQVLKRLAGCSQGVPVHPAYVRFLQQAGRALALLLPPGTAEATAAAAAAVKADTSGIRGTDRKTVKGLQQAAAAGMSLVWPDWQQGVLQVLLLRQRTAWYSSETKAAEPAGTAATEGAPSVVTWKPVQVGSCVDLAAQRLRQALAEQLAAYKKARATQAKQRLVAAAAEALLQHAEDSAAASEALGKIQLHLGPQATAGARAEQRQGAGKGPAATLLGQTVMLLRRDVPAVIEYVKSQSSAMEVDGCAAPSAAITSSMLRALVLGGWTSQGPQGLRRAASVMELCICFGEGCQDLLAAIKSMEKCKRPPGQYRSSGHSSTLQYPGPANWSQAYASERAAAVALHPGVRRSKKIKTECYLLQMQRFTGFADWARAKAAGDSAPKLKVIDAVLAKYDDANQLGRAVAEVEKVLGVKVPALFWQKDM